MHATEHSASLRHPFAASQLKREVSSKKKGQRIKINLSDSGMKLHEEDYQCSLVKRRG